MGTCKQFIEVLPSGHKQAGYRGVAEWAHAGCHQTNTKLYTRRCRPNSKFHLAGGVSEGSEIK